MIKILIIDDEEGIRFTFTKFLTTKNYDVTAAKDFTEAVKCISDSDFDVIFVDIFLSDRSGIDVLREIKNRGIKAPVIMITGYPNIDTASEAIRLDAFDYLPKPVQKDSLLHAVDVALKHKKIIDEKEEYRSNIEAIFSSVKDGIITVDKDLKVLQINEAAEKICGFSKDIIGYKLDPDKFKCTGDCIDSVIRTIKQKKSTEVERLECRFMSRQDQIVSLTTSPLLTGKNIFSGAILVVRDETRLSDLERELNERQQFHGIIGHSVKMQEIYSLIEMLSDVETTVLINGESGTGKELVANALHYNGTRAKNNIVKVNCSALSENLLESELFGHVKGSFTGAIRDKTGRFQLADGGTIFLDEIADIPQKVQVELLRVLQEKEFERVGDSKTIKVNVRVIAATNQDLAEKVKSGKFREDLFYRLNVMKISLPSLSERLDDIPLLVEHFIKKFNKKFKKNVTAISPDVEKIFMSYSWPGNVRELEHVLEHSFILCKMSSIGIDHLPAELKSFHKENDYIKNNGKDNEKDIIIQALDKCAWNKTKAAQLLGLSRRSIYRKIKEYNIEEAN